MIKSGPSARADPQEFEDVANAETCFDIRLIALEAAEQS
jgi:hypothetical protein